MFNLIDAKPKDKILNIGVSNIPEIEMFLEDKVTECWTVDIDDKKMSDANKFLKKTKLLKLDITKAAPIKNNYFDTVVILEVLEHLDDDLEALRWIHSVLKPKGKIVLSVPNDAWLHTFNPVKYFEHKRHYSKEMILSALSRTGFEVKHFNVVENWTILLSLYAHIFNKFLLRRQKPFGVMKEIANKTYMQNNTRGMDFVVAAAKI